MIKYVSIIGFLLVALSSRAGDTIRVSENITATLVFPEKVDLVVLGNTKNFNKVKNGKMVFLNPKTNKGGLTSLFITYGNGTIWNGFIIYDSNANQTMYDYNSSGNEKEAEKNQNDPKEKSTKQDPGKNQASEGTPEDVMRERLNFVIGESYQYKKVGIIKDRLSVAVTNIMNDTAYTYFQIHFKNRSGADYNIDYIGFRFEEGKKKGIMKKSLHNREDKFSIIDNNVTTIPSYESKILGYVIPVYPTGAKGVLYVTFKEAKGGRDVTIAIKSKVLLKVKAIK